MRVKIAEIDLFLLSKICFSSFPEDVLVSALTSTKAGDNDNNTASQSEHKNEMETTKRNERIVINIESTNHSTLNWKKGSTTLLCINLAGRMS